MDSQALSSRSRLQRSRSQALERSRSSPKLRARELKPRCSPLDPADVPQRVLAFRQTWPERLECVIPHVADADRGVLELSVAGADYEAAALDGANDISTLQTLG